MSTSADQPNQRKPLRLWPGVVVVTVQMLVRFGLPIVLPAYTVQAVIAGVLGGFLVVLWWLFLSRAPWVDRLGAVAMMVVALVTTRRFLLHESVATAMEGGMLIINAIPLLSVVFVLWAVTCRNLPDLQRRFAMVVAISASVGVWALVRTGGFSGDLEQDLSWRWSKTAEERLLAQADDETMVPAPVSAGTAATAAAWPGFRGPDRDGTVRGVRIDTDWTASPPVELWRRSVGPAWSSFAISGELFYTQEQRGDEEVVSCYHATTGEPVWRHGDATRFWEANAGAGPRGTPTVAGGHVYAFGATGIVNALAADDGTVVWSRNAASDTGTELPTWGFASSPLVVADLLLVAPSGALVAYDRTTGEPRWTGPSGGTGYSSPHPVRLDGAAQIVQLNGDGAVAVAPSDGALLWQHPWKGYPIVQPASTADGDLLLAVSQGSGMRRLSLAQAADSWSVEVRWTSRGLKPYYGDFVVHDGHAYGFDGSHLSCIDLADGQRTWKGGRYGSGQLLLIADQDLLLVLGEKGRLALVAAKSAEFTEIARFDAIEGKTWNHPALVGDLLLVRNGEEMAAFRLTRAAG